MSAPERVFAACLERRALEARVPRDPALPEAVKASDGGGLNTPTARWLFPAGLTAVFILLTLPRLLRHELWRDEAWLWLVVSESKSLPDLFAALARSGQGYLFPLLCYWVRQAFSSPLALQGLQLAVASAGVMVFARHAPFSRAVKAVLLLGYFPFYEYAVLSRHYALGMLLLWVACAAARRPGREPVLGAALALLCQTTVYGYIVAIAVAAGWWSDSRGRQSRGPSGAKTAAGLALAASGAALGLAQLVPKGGTSFAPGWHLVWDARLALATLRLPWCAFVPVPPLRNQFWNVNVLDGWPLVESFLGAAALILAFAVLWPRRGALVTFVVGSLGLLAFAYLKLLGVLRHHGHFWLLLIAALWLGGGWPNASPRRAWRSAVLFGLAACQIGAALLASAVDWREPFSNAPAAAAILRRAGLEDELLLGHREPPAASVALALGRPLYAPSRRVFTTHPDWGPEQREMADDELRCAARGLAEERERDVVLVLSHPIAAWPELDAVGAAQGAIAPGEDFWIYRLRFARLPETRSVAACANRVDGAARSGASSVIMSRPP
jgi:hypothetical protein